VLLAWLTNDVGCHHCVVTDVDLDQQVHDTCLQTLTHSVKPDADHGHTANMSDNESSADDRMHSLSV